MVLEESPGWSREEIVVLVEGKRLAEKRAGKEGKWEWVSWYCKRQGVKRGAVQCRKRWSDLVGDYNKIKQWESQETESFWVMRNELRRERKLPGFFDREVYDILDGVSIKEAVFDSGRREDGLFDDDDDDDDIPISGTANEKQAASNPEMGFASPEDRKRKRVTTDGDENSTSLQNHLIEVLEKNGKMLTAQLEAQNTNFQLDREQRKDHAETLVSVLDRLANALAKIADKL